MDYRKKVIDLIANKSGMDVSEIEDDAFFEDDLNVGQMELVDILTELEDMFHIELMEDKEDIETVQDLLDLVSEQVE